VPLLSPLHQTNYPSSFLPTGIYQPETFKRESKYGLTVLTTTDAGLLSYLSNVMSQMSTWLSSGDVQRLVVVVSGIDSGETLERWQFNVSVEDGKTVCTGTDENVNGNVSVSGGEKGKKTVKEVHDEIQAIIRQITASVSILLVSNCCVGLP
jgi:mitotic spindle assembly checkpoint protein MAD2